MPHNDPVKIQRAKELRRAMTPAERELWRHLRTNRLDGHHFYRQVVLHGFIVDFYCPATKLVLELDGDIHLGQLDYDAKRDAILTAAGLHVHRIHNDDILHNLPTVLRQIALLCGPDSRNPPQST